MAEESESQPQLVPVEGQSFQHNDALFVGAEVLSDNGKFRLLHQSDGNVVLYKVATGAPKWATDTNGQPSTHFVLQDDGNIALYNDHDLLWSAGTSGEGGAMLALQNDGNLVLYNDEGGAVWASNTAEPDEEDDEDANAAAEAPVDEVPERADETEERADPEAEETPSAAEPFSNEAEFDEEIDLPANKSVEQLFGSLDMNGNGMLSLAELDKAVIELWPKFNNKPAIMRAYKAADKNETGFVSKSEFVYFLQYIVVFHNTWRRFAALDTSGDRRLSEAEFVSGAAKVGVTGKSEAQLKAMFDDMDKNDGGYALFDEFCAVFANEAVLAAKAAEAAQQQQQQQPKQPAPVAKKPAPPASKKAVAAPPPSKFKPTPPSEPKRQDTPPAAQPPSESHSVELRSSKGPAATAAAARSSDAAQPATSPRRKVLPVIDTTLAQPRRRPPPKPETPDDPPAPFLPPIKPKKMRIEGDPTIDALEEKLRQRKREERERREAMQRKIEAAQEEFKRQQEALEQQRHEQRMEELRLKREASQHRREQKALEEEMRLERLKGRVKVDMDVITGKKSILELHAERDRALKEQEERERLERLQRHKENFRTGRDFYKELQDHAQREKERYERELQEREQRKQEVSTIPKLPDEFETKARKEVLMKDKQEKVERDKRKQVQYENFRNRYAYAADVKANHKPTKFKPFTPEEPKTTTPRQGKDPHTVYEEGNENLDMSLGRSPGRSPAALRSPQARDNKREARTSGEFAPGPSAA